MYVVLFFSSTNFSRLHWIFVTHLALCLCIFDTIPIWSWQVLVLETFLSFWSLLSLPLSYQVESQCWVFAAVSLLKFISALNLSFNNQTSDLPLRNRQHPCERILMIVTYMMTYPHFKIGSKCDLTLSHRVFALYFFVVKRPHLLHIICVEDFWLLRGPSLLNWQTPQNSG